jgi:hypothetical protein
VSEREPSFLELSPPERVERVRRYQGARSKPEDTIPLAEATERWLEWMQRLVVEDDHARAERFRPGWEAHLAALSEAEADEAANRLYAFWLYADGLFRAEKGDEAEP